MQRVGSGLLNESQVVPGVLSTALAEQNQVAILPVWLLREDVVAARDDVQVENRFQMKMDAHGFTPDELVVRVAGQCLVVTGQRQTEGHNPDGGSYHMVEKVHPQTQLPLYLDPTAMPAACPPRASCVSKASAGHHLLLKSQKNGLQDSGATALKKGSNLA